MKSIQSKTIALLAVIISAGSITFAQTRKKKKVDWAQFYRYEQANLLTSSLKIC